MSNLTWNEKSDLPDRSYSALDIVDYFEFIIEKQETLTDYPPIMFYLSKVEIGLHFKLKQVLSKFFKAWSKKLLGSTTSKVTKN